MPKGRGMGIREGKGSLLGLIGMEDEKEGGFLYLSSGMINLSLPFDNRSGWHRNSHTNPYVPKKPKQNRPR